MAPYYNQNNDVLMISYVVPIYYENIFIGVVGMDFDYTVLTEIIQKIKIYENGFAHLELNNAIVHDGTENVGIENLRNNEEDYLIVSEKLTNGMTLVLSASYDDIRQVRYEIGYKLLFIMLLLALIFSLVVIFTVKKIVKPLKKLIDASAKLSKGDYDIEIAHSKTTEINLLSIAFENLIVNLREHKNLQHQLAHRDPLTGLRNTISYNGWTVDFNKKIKEENVSFGIIVLDINYLKETNDTYGHSFGNELIVTAAQLISDTFKRSPVFRIGGDEFLVILQNRDLSNRKRLFAEFEEQCAMTCIKIDDVTLPVSIAKGFSEFDPEKDTQFSEVFERADNEMYKAKKLMKEANN
jgi:diguanylate cyclase (GGDEF)-like protein